MKKPVLILGAMDGEIRSFIDHSDVSKNLEWAGFTVYKGKMKNKPVVISKSGVGKSMSATLAQKLIDAYRPAYVIFTGLAGAINPEYTIGDVVLSRDCMIHDIDATTLGFKRGEIPYTPYRLFKADKELHDAALEAVIPAGKIHSGRILTGDQFINKAGCAEYAYLKDELEGDAVEMEGASVALVCTLNRAPFLLVRTISDKADGSANVDFERFLPVASETSYEVVRAVLEEVK